MVNIYIYIYMYIHIYLVTTTYNDEWVQSLKIYWKDRGILQKHRTPVVVQIKLYGIM